MPSRGASGLPKDGRGVCGGATDKGLYFLDFRPKSLKKDGASARCSRPSSVLRMVYIPQISRPIRPEFQRLWRGCCSVAVCAPWFVLGIHAPQNTQISNRDQALLQGVFITSTRTRMCLVTPCPQQSLHCANASFLKRRLPLPLTPFNPFNTFHL